MKPLSYDSLKSQLSLHRSVVGLIIIGLIVILAIGISTAGAQVFIRQYNVTDIGALPAKKAAVCVPAAINDQGQVTGASGMVNVDESAFLYRQNAGKDMMEDLGRNYTGTSHGLAINAVGDVVGDVTFFDKGAVRHAALFRNGKIADLGTLKGDVFSRATGINASGQVVGFSSTGLDETAIQHAFIWSTATGMQEIPTLGGASTQAFGINNLGSVTGTSELSQSGRFPTTHAFIYLQYPVVRMIDLGTLGGNESYGMAINLNNHVVGYSTFPNRSDRIHAFLYDGIKMHDLGSLDNTMTGNDQSYALGVNMADDVVGYTFIQAIAGSEHPTRQTAFIYRMGEMTNLNDLITPEAAKQYWLRAAVAINNMGQIVAIAEDLNTYETRAVLLTH